MFSVVRESRVSGYPFLIPAGIYLLTFLHLLSYIRQSDSASRFCSILINRLVPLLESDKLFFHLLLNGDREEPS